MLNKQIRSLVEYVDEVEGEERMYALCILADFALESGSEEALRTFVKVTLNIIGDRAELVRSAAADFLNQSLRSLPNLSAESKNAIGIRVEQQMDAETAREVRRKLHRVLVTLGLREKSISIKNGIRLVTAIATVLSQGSLIAA